MNMKEPVVDLLGGFLEKHKDYLIEVYVRNAITDNKIITQLLITNDRIFSTKDDNCSLAWEVGSEVKFNKISFHYDEVMDCYIGYCEPDMRELFQDSVVVMMKNGMKYEFECCGIVA